MDKDDFVYAPTEIGWFSSEEGRKLLMKAEEEGLIKRDGEELIADFDYKDEDIPLGFEPSKDIFQEKGEEKSLFSQILEEVVDRSDKKRQDIMSKVNEKQDRLNIDIEVALLLVADELDVELERKDDYIQRIERKVRGIEE